MSHHHIVERIAEQLAIQSDLRPQYGGDVIYIPDCKAVHSEVIQQLAILALANGVRQYMITTLPQGKVRFEIMSHSGNLCWVCAGEGYKLHDDGVCYLCRDPNVEPGEQCYKPEYLGTFQIGHNNQTK